MFKRFGFAALMAVVGVLSMAGDALALGEIVIPAPPAGLDAAALQTSLVTYLTPWWGAILGVCVMAFCIGAFVRVFVRRTTRAFK